MLEITEKQYRELLGIVRVEKKIVFSSQGFGYRYYRGNDDES